MTLKTIIKGKETIVCDICGNEIEIETRDMLSLLIKQQWWKIFNIKGYDICGKHRKEFEEFIKKMRLNSQKIKGDDAETKK